MPVVSEHSAQSTPLPICLHPLLWRYTCLLGSDMESKGDNITSSAEQRIGTQGLWEWISSRQNACGQTDWAIADPAKNSNSIARPYDQPAFSPLEPTADMVLPLALVIYIFCCCQLWCTGSKIVIPNRKETCCLPLVNPGSLEPYFQQTECPLTNWLN